MSDALAGLRVLDFTQAWAGRPPRDCSATSAADVIKVESEARPDLGRLVGALSGRRVRSRWRPATSSNGTRNKRSIRLNLREPDDVALARRLAASCDALVENFAPGVMERLGLDYETLRADNPRLVMLSLSGFGATGPLRRSPAFGQQIEAISGLMSVTGYARGAPLKPGVSYPDPLSGIAGAAAVLAALRERRETGVGQWLDLAMLEITTAQLSEPLVGAQLTGSAPTAVGNAGAGYAPHGVYRCSGDDRWLAIECRDQAEWERLVETLGTPASLTDERFAQAEGRLTHQDDLDSALSELTAGREAGPLATELQERGVPAARVATLADTFGDEHLRARGFWMPITHAKLGTLDTAGPMAVLSETPSRVRVQPALLGEHSDEIVAELAAIEAASAPSQAASTNGAVPSPPLGGLRVVEICSDVAGPYAAKLLGGLGADVVKVELGEGDSLRTRGPQPDGASDEPAGAAFLGLNAGKRGVHVDLASSTDASVSRACLLVPRS